MGQRGVSLIVTTLSLLLMTGAAAGAQEPVGGCPNGTWELIGTDKDPFLESIDKNGDDSICRQPSRTPDDSPHTGVTVTDNNRRTK